MNTDLPMTLSILRIPFANFHILNFIKQIKNDLLECNFHNSTFLKVNICKIIVFSRKKKKKSGKSKIKSKYHCSKVYILHGTFQDTLLSKIITGLV